MLTLRDGSTTADRRLDRIIKFDPKSRAFPVASAPQVAEKKPRSFTHACTTYNDQGAEGACVGFGWGHELAARPAATLGVSAAFSRERIYWPAQRIDEWEGGSYPGASPFYEGTSVLAGAKVLLAMGAFKQYRWVFSLHDLIMAVGYVAPVVMGLNWHEGMFNTDANGYIRPTGAVMGGHCILARGVSVTKRRFLLHNSWGKGWGVEGLCWVSFDDMDQLLHEQGEGCVPMEQNRRLLLAA